jgi:predicted O-methyltransferase YrrM
LSKNQKKLVEKVNIFREWLVSQTSFSLKIVDIGDGLAIISKLE